MQVGFAQQLETATREALRSKTLLLFVFACVAAATAITAWLMPGEFDPRVLALGASVALALPVTIFTVAVRRFLR